MRRANCLIMTVIVSVSLIVTGCIVTSMHPLYFEENVVFEPELLGTWSMKDDNSSWMFKKGEGDVYRLFIFDEESSGKFEAHLLKLGDYRFLDIFPEEPGKNMNGMYALHLVPVHSFYRVSIEGDTLTLGDVDLEEFDELIEQKKTDIKYEKFNDRYLLTAPTKELQEFFLKRAAEDGFEIYFLFRREDVE